MASDKSKEPPLELRKFEVELPKVELTSISGIEGSTW